MSHAQDKPKEENDCPVTDELCKARMGELRAYFIANLATALLTIALVIVELART